MWSDNDGMIHQIKLQGTDNIVKPHETVLIFVSHQEAVPLSIERLGIDLCCLISGDVTAFAPLKWFKCWTWWQYERIWKVKMRNVYLKSHKHALRFLFAPTEVTVVQQKRCTAIPAMKPFVVNLWDTNGCQYDFKKIYFVPVPLPHYKLGPILFCWGRSLVQSEQVVELNNSRTIEPWVLTQFLSYGEHSILFYINYYRWT